VSIEVLPQGERERPVGSLEWLLWMFRMNIIVAARIRGPLDAATLRQALDATQRRHPLLNVRVACEGRDRFHFRAAQEPIPLTVIDDAPAQWEAAAEREMNIPFRLDDAPSMRCVLVGNDPADHMLLLVYSHGIGDGRSGIFMLRDVLDAAARILAGGDGAIESKPLLHAQERYLLGNTGRFKAWRYYLRFTAQSVMASMRNKRKRKVRERRPAASLSTGEFQSALLTVDAEPELIEALQRRAREEKATLHGALCAAHLQAFAAQIADGDPASVCFASSINLQTRVESPVTDDVMLFISGVDATCDVDPRAPLWDLARHSAQVIRERMQRDDFIIGGVMSVESMTRLRRWMPPTDEGFRKLMKMVIKSSPLDTVVSSISDLGIPAAYGTLKIDGCYGLSNNPSVALMSLAIVSGGRLCWTFVYHRDAISREWVERMSADAVARLRAAVREGEGR
jgi:Condensation domain